MHVTLNTMKGVMDSMWNQLAVKKIRAFFYIRAPSSIMDKFISTPWNPFPFASRGIFGVYVNSYSCEGEKQWEILYSLKMTTFPSYDMMLAKASKDFKLI
jgi:hypothetical protein